MKAQGLLLLLLLWVTTFTIVCSADRLEDGLSSPPFSSFPAAADSMVNSFAGNEPQIVPGTTMIVAAVQFNPRPSVKENTAYIAEQIKAAAQCGARVVVFQECAVTGYSAAAITAATPQQLQEAEATLAAACRTSSIYAVVGAPHRAGADYYDTAAVFDPHGELLARYAKIQLSSIDQWAKPGDQLLIFPVDEVWCSVIICHDERFPELVRLPVLAGARVVFYVSSESSITEEQKLAPYRSQICARADENDVYIVQANSPALLSHGQSRIIGPDGIVMAEAGMFTEELILGKLEISKATAKSALDSLQTGSLREWWQQGIMKVKRVQGSSAGK